MRCTFFVFGLLAFLSVRAQFSDSVSHRILFSALGNINRTNSGTSYLFTNEAGFSLHKKKLSLNSDANWIYGKQQGTLSNNDFMTSVDFNRFFPPSRFYYWGLANYTNSYSLKIADQLQAGLGVAYNFIDTTNIWLNLSDGLLYETSQLTGDNVPDSKYQTVRNSLRLSFHFGLRGRLSIDGVHYLQNSLQERSDFIIRSTTSLDWKLNQWLRFSTGLIYNQYSRTARESLLFTYGLKADKFF